MRILDLDLDFFLNDVAYLQPEDQDALSSLEYRPWSRERVRGFLEYQCGCAAGQPIPGRTVMYHDSAFDFWSELVSSGRLSVPFEITHVDAHSDLGLGSSQFAYLASRLMHVASGERLTRLDRAQVDSGNYITFAIACRWVSKVLWVRHPHSGHDLPSAYFKTLNAGGGLIQLRAVDQHAFEVPPPEISFARPPALAYEPEVPFHIQSWKTFQAVGRFDYFILSNSPNYTPKESDRLIPVIEQYMRKM